MSPMHPAAVTALARGLLSLAVACLLLPMTAYAQSRDPNQHFFQGFLGDLKGELEGARKDGKKGLVLVYEMEECPFCERFHRTIANRADVQDYYRRHFLVLRMDIRGSAAISGFDGKEVKESDFAVRNRIRATPTTVFHDLDGRELARFAGLPKDGAEFILLGRYVAEGHHGSGPFSAWKRQVQR